MTSTKTSTPLRLRGRGAANALEPNSRRSARSLLFLIPPAHYFTRAAAARHIWLARSPTPLPITPHDATITPDPITLCSHVLYYCIRLLCLDVSHWHCAFHMSDLFLLRTRISRYLLISSLVCARVVYDTPICAAVQSLCRLVEASRLLPTPPSLAPLRVACRYRDRCPFSRLRTALKIIVT
jgi:hypothetical protein